MHISRRSSTLAAVAVLFCAASLSAQTPSRVSLEFRPGVAIPTGDLDDFGANSGVSLGADLMYNFTRGLTGYVGVSHDRFSCDEDLGCSDPVTSTGLQGGLKFLLARDGSVLPWLRGGLIGQKLSIGDGDDQMESDMSLGYEAGAGLDLDISPRFSLVPAVNFRRYEANVDNGSLNLDPRWLSVTLAGHFHFR